MTLSQVSKPADIRYAKKTSDARKELQARDRIRQFIAEFGNYYNQDAFLETFYTRSAFSQKRFESKIRYGSGRGVHEKMAMVQSVKESADRTACDRCISPC